MPATASTSQPDTPTTKLSLFEAVGIELEYMIVDEQSLDVRPLCDELLRKQAGESLSSLDLGATSWSNELVMHVVEMKTTRPAPSLEGWSERFHADARRMNQLLADMNARLLPTAMHPWMDPHTQTRLWPHEQNEIYQAFNRIFDCRGHGWSNLQSLHINLPFADDEQFGRLHAAIRLLLPVMPALTASSPVMDGRITGIMDNRLVAYRDNCRRIPSISGKIIPEPIFTIDGYHADLLQRIYRELAPHDPDGLLQDEWVNARGAIARFERYAIEIRVLDIQECPAADLAVVALIVAALRMITSEQWTSLDDQQAWATEPLAAIYNACIRDAQHAKVDDHDYLAALGLNTAPATARDIWRHLFEQAATHQPGIINPFADTLDTILRRGTLARAITRSLGQAPDHHAIHQLYNQLADCLQANALFQ